MTLAEKSARAGLDDSQTAAPGEGTTNGYQRLRILMVSDFFYPNCGGVESLIYYLPQCLLKLGPKVVNSLCFCLLPLALFTSIFQNCLYKLLVILPFVFGLILTSYNAMYLRLHDHVKLLPCSLTAFSFCPGQEAVVITHAYRTRSGFRYMTGGLKVYYIPWKPFLTAEYSANPLWNTPNLRTILIREDISLVHGHRAFSTLWHEALMHARTMGYKVISIVHSLYGFADIGSILMNKVLQFILADVNGAIWVSHTSNENTVLRSGLPPEKVCDT